MRKVLQVTNTDVVPSNRVANDPKQTYAVTPCWKRPAAPAIPVELMSLAPVLFLEAIDV